MSLIDYRKFSFPAFRGWRSLPGDQSPEFALNARNVRFRPGKVGSRAGHTSFFSTLGGVTAIYHWVTQDFSVLVYFEAGNHCKLRVLSSNVSGLTPGKTYLLFSQEAAGISMAEFGKRALFSGYNSSGAGTGQVKILDFTSSAFAYNAFPAPMSAPAVVTEPGAPGNITAGVHKIGYVLVTMSGGETRPCPEVFGTFMPTEFAASGGKTLNVSVTANWPQNAYALRGIMTRADNHDKWYFVPGAGSGLIPPGAQNWQVNFVLNYSDESLIANEADLDASEQFLLMTQSASGTGPFSPSDIVVYGTRMVYVVDDVLYISDPGNAERITMDQHSKILPGRRKVTTAFPVADMLVVLGPHWTYAFADNGDRPATWAAPRQIGDGIGVLGPKAKTFHPTGGYGWVADENGLYFFNGEYSDLPISYFNQAEWQRINKAQGHLVQVFDDPESHTVSVIAPLDGATACTHILKWDYTLGKSPGLVQFSLDDIQGYSIGAIGKIVDPVTRRTTKLLGPASAGDILQEDDSARNDGSAPIVSVYETGLVPPDGLRTALINVIRAHVARVRGNGSLKVKFWANGHNKHEHRSYVLEEAPAKELLMRLEQQTPQGSLELGTSELDHWWELETLTSYWSDQRNL